MKVRVTVEVDTTLTGPRTANAVKAFFADAPTLMPVDTPEGLAAAVVIDGLVSYFDGHELDWGVEIVGYERVQFRRRPR